MRWDGGWVKLDFRLRCSILSHRRKLMLEAKKNPPLEFLIAALLLALACRALAQPEAEVLTHAADVISLSAERASASLKVSVTGVVTSADAALKGRFFVQD